MAGELFEVRPVQRYDGARYPSAYRKPAPTQPEEAGGPSFWRVFLAALLAVWLVTGIPGCALDRDLPVVTQDPRNEADSGLPPPDPDPPVPARCAPGEMLCSSDDSLGICDADGRSWITLECRDVCAHAHGPTASVGICTGEGENPCGCEIGRVVPVVPTRPVQPPVCAPGEAICRDEYSMAICDEDGQTQATVLCNDYCQERFGLHSGSSGCNPAAAMPCECNDIVDGYFTECTPEDLLCQDESTLMVCDEGSGSWNHVDCNDYCNETLGPDSFSTGCTANVNDPCGCEYDMVAGEYFECTPGEIYCSDESTAVICESEQQMIEVSCEDYCREVFGEDSHTTGCESANTDNPCGCQYSNVDGGAGAE